MGEPRTIQSLRQRARRSHPRSAASKTGVLDAPKLKLRISRSLEKARTGRSELAVVLLCLDRPVTEDPTAGWNEEIDRELAARLQRLAGPQSAAGRLTDSDLCLVLTKESVGAARELIDGLRPLLDLASASQGQAGSNRWSAGIATYPDHGETVGELLMAAEGAAQDAKLASRDRVQVALAPETREALEILLEPKSGERPAEAAAGSTSSASAEPASTANQGEGRADPLSENGHSAPFRWYVTVLVLGATVLALLSSSSSIAASPVLFALVLGSVVALDLVSIDVFKRGKVSPAAVPILALAYYFGPLGPIVAEAVIAIRRAIRREPVLWWAFDLGVLSLAGGAAALVFDIASPGEDLWVIGSGAMAALAYYAVNTGLLLPGLAFTEHVTLGSAWRDQMAWLWPHYIAFGVVAAGLVLLEQKLGALAILLIGVPIALLWVAEKQYIERSRKGVEELRNSHDQLESANRHLRALLSRNEELLGQMQRSMLSTIVSLARSIEARDPGTGDHTGRVAEIASDLARELGLDERELRAIRIGAVIHDIGKIGIPDGVLLKPGKLDDAEFAAMRKHPEISSYIIAELDLPPMIKQMCRNHHERFDGSGYPDRLVGEEIPLVARILAVADSFDAMTSDRPYRRAMEPATARAEIEKNAGQFCPRVVCVLSRLLEDDPGRWTREVSIAG